jgi:soluble lytic murein transglycosylase
MYAEMGALNAGATDTRRTDMGSANLTRRLAWLLASLVCVALLVLGALLAGPPAPAGAAGFSGPQRSIAAQEIRPVEWVELLVRLRQEGRAADLFRAVAFLEEIRPGLIVANGLYALAGDAAREAGDLERALGWYTAALDSAPPIADALRLRRAEVLAALGRPAEAEAGLGSLPASGSPPRLRKQALRLLASAWRQAGDLPRAAACNRLILADRDLRSEHAEARLELARLELEQGRPAAAAAELKRLLRSRRSTLGKVEALELLRGIESEHRGVGGPVRAADRLDRGRLLLEAGAFGASVEELEAAVRGAGTGPVASEARYLLGRVEYRRERYERAVERYREAIRHEPQRRFRQRCLMQAARCLQLLGRTAEASGLYTEVLRLEAGSFDAASARYELAALAEREGKAEAAVAAYEALGEDRRHPIQAGAALLHAIRLRSASGQGATAVAAARRLLEAFPRSRHAPQAHLLLARELERLGRTSEAIAAYRRCLVELPGTLEARLAGQALVRLAPGAPRTEARAGSPPDPQPFLDVSRQIPWPSALLPAPAFASAAELQAWLDALGDPALARIRIHLRLGQHAEAAEELAEALRHAPDNVDWLGGLISLSHALGRPHRALAYAERLAGLFPAGLLPRPVQSQLYPWPYRERIEELAGRIGVDPLLAVAVMRQESRFNPEARSFAAARGLMQIVPVTFEGLRQWLARPELELEDLHRPEVSLELGMAYLGQLGERFEGRPEVVLAAYNAGPGNAQRWLDQTRGGDLVDFLAAIPFKETRDYVRIVLENWWAYCELYRGRPPPESILAAPAGGTEVAAGPGERSERTRGARADSSPPAP